MRSRPILLNLFAACAILLSGCATGTSSAELAAPDEAGVEHGAHDGHASGNGPSETARMICSENIQGSVAAVYGLSQIPPYADSYSEGLYSCNYGVPGGLLELSVMESPDEAVAKDHAETMRGSYSSAEDITGIANLGLYAYRTPDGVVVFVKDNMTLTVDATQTLPDAETGMSQSQVAYQVATNVLACWKAHP